MRGARMTPVRRQVLELILRADQPIKAYALLARLEEEAFAERLASPGADIGLDA